MKVLHTVTLGPHDGRGIPGPMRVALSIAQSAASAGHAAELWTTSMQHRKHLDELHGRVLVRVHPARQLSSSTLASIASRSLLADLSRRATEFDLVHLHLGRDLVMLPAAAVLAMRGVPFVTQTHGMVEPGGNQVRRAFDRCITRQALRRGRAAFALQRTEEEWLRAVGVDPGRIQVVPNAAEPDLTIDDGGTKLAKPTVLFLAHLRPRKRVMDFYTMARSLHKVMPDVHFLVIGPDGGDLPQLQAALAEDDLDGFVEYGGALPAPAARGVTAAADIYCMPAVNEPFPISVLDAWSVGTPVVMTSECHISDLALEHDAALVAQPEPHALAEAVSRLLREPSLRARIAANAERLLKTQLSRDAVWQTVHEHYLTALQETVE